jgi:hypothetical protein
VGFTNGWQAATVMATQAQTVHAKRLGQGSGVRLTLRAHAPDGTSRPAYMQLDGEPWKQMIPGGEEAPPVVVEVYHAGRAKVLINTADPKQRVKKMADVMPEGMDKKQYLKGQKPGDSNGGGIELQPAAAGGAVAAAAAAAPAAELAAAVGAPAEEAGKAADAAAKGAAPAAAGKPQKAPKAPKKQKQKQQQGAVPAPAPA